MNGIEHLLGFPDEGDVLQASIEPRQAWICRRHGGDVGAVREEKLFELFARVDGRAGNAQNLITVGRFAKFMGDIRISCNTQQTFWLVVP
jgi:hypothetical protein